jgi:predicted RNA binding protein YcfA (HicA-like mRNA interferase family)
MPLKVREIIKMIESDGWLLARTRGSHRQYVHPTTQGVVTIAGSPGADLHAAQSEASRDRRACDGGSNSEWVRNRRRTSGRRRVWRLVARVPDCVALGDTVDEAVAEMQEAIKLHLELLGERGEPLPAPTAVRVDLLAA